MSERLGTMADERGAGVAAPGGARQCLSRRSLAFVSNPAALVGLVIVAAADPDGDLRAAACGGHLTDRAESCQPACAAQSAEHWFGTDELGRDIYARTLYGARVTLTIVMLVSVVVAPIGLAVGTLAGYLGGWVDAVLMRITDIFLAFPRLVLALAFAAALGPGIENAVIAISLTAWPPYARIARSETVTIARSDFISAVVLQGASTWRILFRHIVPLCLSSVIVRLTLDMAGIILTAAGLGFLGLGRPAADGGMGRHGLVGPRRDPRPVVGRDHSGHRHLHRQPGLQPSGRRIARRVRSEDHMSDTPPRRRRSRTCPFRGAAGITRAVRNATFTLGRERLGIVGESGSGKVHDRPRPARPHSAPRHRHCQDHALRRRRSPAPAPSADWQQLRGRRMSMVMQDPKYSLNPVKKVGHQIGETCRLHHRLEPQRTPRGGPWRCWRR